MARYARLLSILSVLVLLLAGCGDGGEDEGTETETATSTEAAEGTPTPVAEETISLTGGESANSHGEVDASGDDTLEFELDDNYFEPTVIMGTAGQELTLEAFNEGGNIHNFSLTDQQIDQDFSEDAEEEIEVSFPDSGSVTFFCKYHAELGMRGELRVA
jgi:plastocyanin